MNRGEGKFYVIFALLLLAAVVYGVVQFGPVFQRKWKMGKEMDDGLRTAFAREGIDHVVEALIHKADVMGLPPLTADDFNCDDCEVETMSKFTLDYTETIHFPGNKDYEMPIHIEINIKIPPPPF